MNKKRRDRLSRIFDQLSSISDELESIKDEERESLDNLPDNFRYGERGEEMENYIEMLNEVQGYILDANSVIEQI